MDRLGDEVERELARGGSRDAIPLAALTRAWPTAVGPAIARQAWPLRIGRDGTLHVATASATWANELTLLGEDILGRLRAQLGDETPGRLRCAVGPIPEPVTPPPAAAPAPAEPAAEAPPDVASAALSAASAIEDPELRELVARAARASLGREASDRHF